MDPVASICQRPTSLGRADVTIWGAEEVNDLSPLRGIDASALAVIGARQIDWQTIFSLPLDSLDFSRCSYRRAAAKRREAFSAFDLSRWHSSEVGDVDFARGMPLV